MEQTRGKQKTKEYIALSEIYEEPQIKCINGHRIKDDNLSMDILLHNFLIQIIQPTKISPLIDKRLSKYTHDTKEVQGQIEKIAKTLWSLQKTQKNDLQANWVELTNDMAHFSYYVYYSHPGRFLPNKYEIILEKEYFGICFVALKGKNRYEIFIVFRGTQTSDNRNLIFDLKSIVMEDGDPFFNIYSNIFLDIASLMINNCESNFFFCGHSLGGHLAQTYSVIFNIQGAVFNAPPLNTFTLPIVSPCFWNECKNGFTARFEYHRMAKDLASVYTKTKNEYLFLSKQILTYPCTDISIAHGMENFCKLFSFQIHISWNSASVSTMDQGILWINETQDTSDSQF